MPKTNTPAKLTFTPPPYGGPTSAPRAATSQPNSHSGPVCVCEPLGRAPTTAQPPADNRLEGPTFALPPEREARRIIDAVRTSHPPTTPLSDQPRSPELWFAPPAPAEEGSCRDCEDPDCLDLGTGPDGSGLLTIRTRPQPSSYLIGDERGNEYPRDELSECEDAPSAGNIEDAVKGIAGPAVFKEDGRLETESEYYARQESEARKLQAWWSEFPCLRRFIRAKLSSFEGEFKSRTWTEGRAGRRFLNFVDDTDIHSPIRSGSTSAPSAYDQAEAGSLGGVGGRAALAAAISPYVENQIPKAEMERRFASALGKASLSDLKVALKLIRWPLGLFKSEIGPLGEPTRAVCFRGNKTLMSEEILKAQLKEIEKAIVDKLRSELIAKRPPGWPAGDFHVQDMQRDPQLVVDALDLMEMANGRDDDYFGLSAELSKLDENAPTQPAEGEPVRMEQDRARNFMEALSQFERRLRGK